MGNLSKNFDRNEFQCHGKSCCGHSAPISLILVQRLQSLRDRIKHPIYIVSGFRCQTWNKQIGSKATSQHTLGLAADIRSDRYSPDQLAEFAELMYDFQTGGIGIYENFLHLDIRGVAARWRGDQS